MNISNSLSRVSNSIQSIHSEHIVIQTLLYPVTPLWQLLCQFSSLTIAYPNIVLNSSSLALLVQMYASFRTPSHHTVLWKLHSSPFLTKWILLEICLVFLVYLQLFSIQIDDLLSIIMSVSCSGTTHESLFKNQLFRILQCDGFHPKTPPFSTRNLILVNYKVLSQLSQPISLLFSYLNSVRHNLVI